MGFRYALCKPDGEVFDEAEYAYQPGPGDDLPVRQPAGACAAVLRLSRSRNLSTSRR